jgi:hypothetical protein
VMRSPIFRGRVEHNKLKLDNREGFQKLIESLNDKKIEIILRERTVGRSEQANRYYRGIVIQDMADFAGFTNLEMHNVMKKELGIVTTTKLSTKEFQEYVEHVRRIAAEKYGLNIPGPNEVEF